jgi:zinc-binding alcohol dehydrogenase family protein
VSVNPVDAKERVRTDPGEFRVLGFDAVGTVRAVGDEATLFAPGDRVYYAGSIRRPGSNQRLQAVDERIVATAPTSLTDAQAAALPLTAITAWEALFDKLALTTGSTGTLLVVGATGGVGAVLLQIAEALLPGVTVIGTASDDERARYVRSLGAEHVVDHRGDIAGQVLAIAPDGIDHVFTAHSDRQAETYARLLRPFGQIVGIDGGPGDFQPLRAKSISWHWEFMFSRPIFEPADMIAQHELLGRVAGLVDDGRIRSTTTTELAPISAATLREAHRLIETGRTVGKIVLSGWE